MKENLAVYEALRNSIVSCEERIRNEKINMYVVYFAMLSFGFTYNWLFLVMFIVLIAFQAMINADRLSIEKTSTYIRVFFEEERKDMHWESLHKDKQHLAVYHKQTLDIGWIFDKAASSVLAVISLLSLIFTIIKEYGIEKIPLIVIAEIVVAFVLCLFVIHMNSKLYVNNGNKQDQIAESIEGFYRKNYDMKRTHSHKVRPIKKEPCRK